MARYLTPILLSSARAHHGLIVSSGARHRRTRRIISRYRGIFEGILFLADLSRVIIDTRTAQYVSVLYYTVLMAVLRYYRLNRN